MIEFKFKTLTKFPRAATPPHERKDSPFKRPGRKDGERWIGASATPLSQTYDDLRKELTYLKVSGPVVIQVALAGTHIRLDGLLRADAPRPRDPGVILSFEAMVAGRKGPLTFACDDCVRWEDNLRAIVLTLERLRLADLYGVTKGGEQYKGWSALPPSGGLVTSGAAEMTAQDAARLVLAMASPLFDRIDDAGLRDRAATSEAEDLLCDRELFKKLYHLAAAEFHPDNNGQRELPQWAEIHRAKAVVDKHYARG